MDKTENKTEGLKLYTLKSNFDNDVTKNCGLTGVEIDGNFLFLRNNDIYRGDFDENTNSIVLYKGSGETVVIPNVRENIKFNNGYFDSNTNTIVINTNNGDITITGITTNNVSTIQSINGNGSINNPIRLSELYKSPFLPSAKTIVDLTNDEKISDEYKSNGSIIITKEFDNVNGLLYNFNGIESIKTKLENENSFWHIPSTEEWGEMLNAIEPCNDVTHLQERNGDFGKFAGAFLKNDGINWNSESSTSFSYGFKANPSGFKISIEDTDSNYGYSTRFWSSSVNSYDEVWVRQLDYNKSTVKLTAGDKDGFFSLRLVNDDTKNFIPYAQILGEEYEVVKMPYIKFNENGETIESGYKLWTSVNFSHKIDDTNCVSVENDEKNVSYYLNFWNGEYWEKRKIKENDIITIEDKSNSEYKLINGEFKKLFSSNSENNNIDLSNYYTKSEIDNTYATIEDVNLKQDKINDLTDIRNNANKSATAVQPENLKTINSISLIQKENESNISLNDFYYTKQEVDDIVNGIVADDIDLLNYYKKNEVDDLINSLKDEIEYLKSIISRVFDISLTKNNGEKLDENDIQKLDTVIKEIEPGEGGEIVIDKQRTTVYIDINPDSLGELTEIN